MKRYAFTGLFTIVGIVGIIIFYAYVNRTVSAHENITIETLSGDEAEVNDVTLFGVVYNNAGDVEYDISLSKDNTEIGESSYVYSTADVRFRELQKQYRSFMRGKNNAGSLYEDKEFLIHGDLLFDKETDDTVKREILISMYDKAKVDDWEFIVPLSADIDKFTHFDIVDVQLYNQEVVLMLLTEQSNTQNIWRISVNVNQKSLSDVSLIYSLDSGWNKERDYSTNHLLINVSLAGSSWMTKAKYMPFHVIETEENAGNIIKETNQFFVVDMESGELLEVNLPEKIIQYSNILVNHEHIYYIDEKTGELYKYNVEDGSSDFVFKHEGLINLNNYSYLMESVENKLYFLTNSRYQGEELTVTDKATNLYVMDLQTKQETYHGKIDFKEFNNNYFDFTSIYPKYFD